MTGSVVELSRRPRTYQRGFTRWVYTIICYAEMERSRLPAVVLRRHHDGKFIILPREEFEETFVEVET